ncbi:MAG: hypothetical protein K2K98_15160 [Muribaculaceae bacterium]|nr:hypothetical protein [Muribaculaceae bacterium]
MKKILLFAAAGMLAASASAATVVDKEYNFQGLTGLPGWAPEEAAAKMTCTAEGLVVNNPEATPNFWDLQFQIGGGLEIVDGVEYTVTAVLKANAAGNIHLAFGDWSNKPFQSDFVVTAASSDWQTLSFKATANGDMADAFGLMQSGNFVGEYVLKTITVSHEDKGETPSDPKEEKVLLSMYPGDASLGGWGDGFSGEGVTEDGREAYKVSHPAKSTNSWDAQYAFDYEFEAGTTYYLTFDVKGDEGTITSGLQQTNGYKGCGNFTNFKVTNDWETVTIKCTAQTSENGDANRYVANVGDYVGTLYISNLKLYVLVDGGSAVESIAPVKALEGVYNLQGVKVANSFDEVVAPGLYICNGKKVVR